MTNEQQTMDAVVTKTVLQRDRDAVLRPGLALYDSGRLGNALAAIRVRLIRWEAALVRKRVFR